MEDQRINYFYNRCPLCSFDQDPPFEEWAFETLYKESITGAILFWQVAVFDNQIHTAHGHVDGKIQYDSSAVTPVGGKTMYQQCLQDSRTKYRDKFEKDNYRLPGVAPSEVTAMNGYDIKDRVIPTWPVVVQMKLDGVRLLSHESNGQLICGSRNNRTYNHLYHLHPDLKKLLMFLPANTALDGEVYIHGMNFNQISGIMRTGIKADKTIGAVDVQANQLQYFLFDIITDIPYDYYERHSILSNAHNSLIKSKIENGEGEYSPLQILPYQLCYNMDQVYYWHGEYCNQGYEGTMIKLLKDKKGDKVKYVKGRTTNLLKMKDSMTEDVWVIGVTPGNGRESEMALLTIQDCRGNQLTLRPAGSFEVRKQWLLYPHTVIGKLAIMKYQDLGGGNIPRFPRIIGIRDYE